MIAALLAAAWLSASHEAVAQTSAGVIDTSVATAAPTAAEPSTDPALSQAVGRIFVAGPTAPGWSVLTSTGYGYTESILGRGDAHHRAMGALAIDGRPVEWLSFGLRFDARYDLHIVPSEARDDGWVGEPRLYLRTDHKLGESVRLGLRLGLWLPGGNAPSIAVAAATPDLTAALTYAFSGVPVWLTGNLGYRLDRSARTAEDAARLSASDRSALEVSAFDQILWGVGATFGRDPLRGFVEASADVLVGRGAPSFSTSPARFGGGARMRLDRGFQVEVGAEVATSSRPDLMPTAPLVPVPPRFAIWLGCVYRLGAAHASARTVAIEGTDGSRQPTTSRLPSPDPAAARAKPPAPTVTINGRVQTDDGALPSDLQLFVMRGEAATSKAVVDDEGRFNVSDEAGLEIAVRVESAMYEPASKTVTLSAGATGEIILMLRRRLPSSQIRGLVRSLTGRVLEAQIRIDPSGRTIKTEQGRFELDVEPGSYEVTVVVPGFETQRRHVQVEEHGVTLLNVDLRSAR